ncbi:hypothetical protein SAY87_021631 [Trapa incisa]|uniref:Transcription termination factor MTERF5, chloroplastic n=1 Tax=Trapa incisa TaxID=236973 RepID=A0AAN7JSA9_9MYRT|nr:hypothetical protein SAY87_021631 [Trapa incisa]
MTAFHAVQSSTGSGFNPRIHCGNALIFDSKHEVSVQLCFRGSHACSPMKPFFCRAKYSADSAMDGSFSFRVVSPTLLAAEKEEAKAVLTLFLKKQGLSNVVAARTINKSDLFIEHLVSRLHSIHKSRYLVGRELTTLEIREALVPYLESLLKEHGDILVDVVESFPDPPVRKKLQQLAPATSPTHSRPLNGKKQKTVSRVYESGSSGNLRPNVIYLMEEVGMNLDQIKGIARRFPAFVYYSVEGKIKPVVEFLLDLGVSKSDIPVILKKRPQLCGISLTDNLIPTMAYLEKLGVDKKQWAKVIYRFPALLTYSRSKVKATIDFLYEMGLSSDSVSKILTRSPSIISYSVEDKLRPTAGYFRSIGVDVSVLLHRSPQTFGLSIEGNIKPVTEFFLEKGYSIEEVKTMISRCGTLYTFSLTENLIPKWEFFLTMEEYPKTELVKFPQYFGYSLEERIKPRYKLVKESGISLLLNQLLSLSGQDLEKLLQRKLERASLTEVDEAVDCNNDREDVEP